MPPPLADAIRADVLRRARLGETFDAIAEATGVSKGAISGLTRKAGIAVRSRGGRGTGAGRPPPKRSPPAGRPAAELPRASARPPSSPKKAPTPKASPSRPRPAPAAEPAPFYDPEALEGIELEELDLSALEQLEKGAARLLNIPAIQTDARLFVVVGEFITRLRTSMHRLRPPPKVDPDLDPLNVSARQSVLDRVRGMVTTAQARAAAGAAPPEPPP